MIDIDKYNPYESFRPGQKEAITQVLEAFDRGDKVVELDAPTASGKSLDLFVLGNIFTQEMGIEKAIYTTPLVSLVDQLGDNSMFRGMPILKGKRNYPCELVPGAYADECPFKHYGDAMKYCRSHLRDDCLHCAYQADRNVFKDAKFGATTFARYLVDPMCYMPCEVLFVDESARLEKTLVDRSTFKLPPSIDISNLRDSLMEYSVELGETIQNISDRLAELQKAATMGRSLEEAAQTQRELTKLERIQARCDRAVAHIDAHHDYIVDRERQFRLLMGKSEFDKLCIGLRLIVLASGTPTTELFCDEYSKVVIQHPIPISQRKVYAWPVGSMSYKDRAATIPKMARMISRLHEKFRRKTIVHCGAYTIAEGLYDELPRETQAVAILQDRMDRERGKNRFLRASEAVFLSVEYTEGLDLAGEKYPMNIVAKIPFENLGDEFVKARNTRDGFQRYNTFAAIELMQAAGRCTRAIDDYSETYILDGAWKWFFNKNKKLFKPWFVASLEG